MKKEIYKIDAEGFIIENYLGEFNENGALVNPAGNFITVELPQPLPFYKPKWSGTSWTEGATREEIEELTRVEPSPPTEIELLQQENSLLKAQVQATSERADFHEELIAELAMMIIP